MNERTKKIGMIVLFALSVIAIGTALYFMFFRTTNPEPLSDEPISITDDLSGGLPSTPTGSPSIVDDSDSGSGQLSEADEVAQGDVTQTTILTQSPVFNTVIGSDGSSVQFYDRNDGRFYKIDEEGEIVKLSEKQFPNLEEATWNKDSEKAVLEFPDGSNIVYNFETETQTTLPKHWEDFDFSPVSNEIVAKSLATDPGNRWLVTTNDNGSNVTAFQALGDNADKVQVNWSPNDQVVAFAKTADGLGSFDRKMIIPVGKNSENFQGLIVEGFGFSSSWSPNGRTILYSVAGDISDNKPLLWLVDGTSSTMGNNRRSLAINTWVEKCVWESDSTIFCAVPNNLPDNSGYEPSLYSGVADSLYKIDVTSGSRSLIAIPETDKAMTSLSLSSDSSSLYFTDANTGQLELIKLK
jgi:hypothetical protein